MPYINQHFSKLVAFIFLFISSSSFAIQFPNSEAQLCSLLSDSTNAPNTSAGSGCINYSKVFGGQLVVSYRGKVVYEKAVGAARAINLSPRVSPNSLFRTASLHKAITAIGIMKLYEDGVIGLDDLAIGPNGKINDTSITSHIVQNSGIEEITIDNLLHHASGLPHASKDYPFQVYDIAKQFGEQNRPSLETIVKKVASDSTSDRGSIYYYNNMNYMLLTLLIEKVTGKSYQEYFRDEIFLPLGIQEIKPAKTFREDRYVNEVEYIWPSYNNTSNYVHSYCSARTVAPQYGNFRAEENWIASARALTQLFSAITHNTTGPKILSAQTIDEMFEIEQIEDFFSGSPRNVSRGFADVLLTSNWEWSHSGGIAGTSSRIKKTTDDIMVAFLSNAELPGVSVDNLMDTVINEATAQLSQLPSAPTVTRSTSNSEWKSSSPSLGDYRAGCFAYRWHENLNFSVIR